MTEDETFNKLRRIPFEELSFWTNTDMRYLPRLGTIILEEGQSVKLTDGLGFSSLLGIWQDEGGWDFESFKEEYNRRFGEQ